MTLAELLERFRITAPIDEVFDKELWEEEAMKEFLATESGRMIDQAPRPDKLWLPPAES